MTWQENKLDRPVLDKGLRPVLQGIRLVGSDERDFDKNTSHCPHKVLKEQAATTKQGNKHSNPLPPVSPGFSGFVPHRTLRLRDLHLHPDMSNKHQDQTRTNISTGPDSQPQPQPCHTRTHTHT